MQLPQPQLKVLTDRRTWCFLGFGSRDRLTSTKRQILFVPCLVAECTNRSDLIQSNHHGTECSNLLVHRSAANRHLAGYTALLTNIISSYEKTEQFKMTSYQLKNDKC